MILEDIVIQTTDFRIISIVYKDLEWAKNTQIKLVLKEADYMTMQFWKE